MNFTFELHKGNVSLHILGASSLHPLTMERQQQGAEDIRKRGAWKDGRSCASSLWGAETCLGEEAGRVNAPPAHSPEVEF